ncbi:MAG: DNA-binding domain-containing protein [Planctomycetota bacterium]
MTAAPDLRTLQRWLAAVVQHPATADVAVRGARAQRFVPLARVRDGEVVAANPRLSPVDQLQIYNGGYLARLVEAMAVDYGGVRHVLGEDAFARLVGRYVTHHPSRHPNLNRLGAGFARFVRRQQRLPQRAFLADLAALEWAMCRAFDAPEFAPLPLARFEAVPAAAWPRATLTPNPSLQLVATRFPVNGFYQAWKDEGAPRVPRPAPSWTAVFRRDQRVWRQMLSRDAFAILRALCAGRPLGAAIALGGGETDVGALFRGFAGDGLFVDIAGGKRVPGT